MGYPAAGKATHRVAAGNLPSFMVEEAFRRRRGVKNMLNLMRP
jgi:hypothetical protein